MLCALGLLSPIVAAGAASAPGAAPTEYQLKAVFLFNFARFVEWPPQAFASADAPLAICVLGKDPFGSDLDDAVRGEQVMGRALVVQRYTSAARLGTCHILFVAASETRAPDEALQRRGTLTVTDAPKHHATIRFVTDRQRIRLRIDLASAQAAGLTISSKLLRIADVVPARDS
jgi:hypothetical protein